MSAPGTGPSNFAFVYDEWPGVFTEAYKAERYAVGDPRTSSFYARRALEQAVDWVYDSDGTVQRPYRKDVSALIDEPTFANVTGPAVRAKMDVIRRQGNNAVHRRTTYTESDSVRLVGELFHVLYWLARTYSQRLDAIVLPATFDRDLLPRPLPPGERVKRQAELKQMAEAAAASKAALARSEQRNAELDAQIKELQDQVKAVKAANAARLDVPDHDYDEKTTRSLLIDVRLREAGWDPNAENVREYPVSGMPITDRNKSGAGKADYVLWDDDGKPLAVVEAKRSSRDATEGRQQAKLYADCLQARFGQRPVIFYTNGYVTLLLDDHRSADYPAREVLGFYTKDELRLIVQRRAGKQPLRGVGVDEAIVNRNYQAHAIRRVGEAFETEKRRRALLVMATGSGKTRTIIALVDQLARAGWVKRVLFLADRKALVRQAHNAFKTHLPGLPSVNLLDPKTRSENARVFVSTYPTMMSLINETDDDGVRRFGPGYFDLIVIDEAHRSIYQKYGAIFDWFDALLVGLTATPKDEIDRNTYRLFHLEDGVPTDAYGLDEAVADGYLVPPRAVKVPLQVHARRASTTPTSPRKRRTTGTRWSGTRTATSPTEVAAEEMNQWPVQRRHRRQGARHADDHGPQGRRRRPARQDHHLRQEPATTPSSSRERFDINYPEYAGTSRASSPTRSTTPQTLIDDFSGAGQGAAHRDLASTCSTPASTCPRSSTSCSSSRCARRRSSGR